MRVCGPDNVGKAVQTHPTLLRYASAITELKNCLEELCQRFDQFQVLRNNSQQHATACKRVCRWTQHVTSNNAGSCWPTMLRPFAWGFTKHSSLTSTGDISSILPIRSVKNSVMSFCSPVFSGCLSIVYVRQNVFGL